MNKYLLIVFGLTLLFQFVVPVEAQDRRGSFTIAPLLTNERGCALRGAAVWETFDNPDRGGPVNALDASLLIYDYFAVEIYEADGELYRQLNYYHDYFMPVREDEAIAIREFTVLLRAQIEWPAFPLTIVLRDTISHEGQRSDRDDDIVQTVQITARQIIDECLEYIDPVIEFTGQGDLDEDGQACSDVNLGMIYAYTSQKNDENGNDWIAIVTIDGSGLPLDISFFFAPLFSRVPTGNTVDLDFVYPITARPVKATMYDVPDPREIIPQVGSSSPEALEFAINSPEMVSATWDPGQVIEACLELEIESSRKCSVSTDIESSVTVRVGPGTNRTSILHLPIEEYFSVLGMGFADDESMWLQLDKSEVAPNPSASELWVPRGDVTLSGNCIGLDQVNAPPIIPIINPAPDTTDTDGGDEGGTNENNNSGSIIGGIQAGLWPVTIVKGSIDGPCINQSPQGEQVVSQNYLFTMQPDANGESISVTWAFSDGAATFTMSRTAGTSYHGILFFPEFNSTYTFTLIFDSAMSFQGEVVNAVGACVFYDTIFGQAP